LTAQVAGTLAAFTLNEIQPVQPVPAGAGAESKA
jgi:hypothetical protein